MAESNLTEKLRQQQQLKERNNAHALTGRADAGNARAEPDGSSCDPTRAQRPLAFHQQLDRLRQRKMRIPNAVSMRGVACDKAPLGGAAQTNVQGSFVLLAKTLSEEFAESLKPSGVLLSGIRQLVRLLTGSCSEFDLGEVAFLDTETTGLSGGAGTYAFLVGIGSWGDSGFRVEQYFMRDYHEERAMLLALQERLAGLKVLVTFNGKSFDVPLLESRFVLARERSPLPAAVHIDLLHPARRLWKLRLGDCSLGTLEVKLLQRRRERDVPGAEIPRLYFSYTRTGNTAGIQEILQHNQQDIVTLAELTVRVSQLMSGILPDHAEDLLSTGKYLQFLKEQQLAMLYTESALRSVLASQLQLQALRDLAAILKSRKEYGRAAELWEQVIAESTDPPEEVFAELAKHYEHRKGDLDAALKVTAQVIDRLESGEAQQKWQHRHQRLLRKIGKNKGSEAPLLFSSGIERNTAERQGTREL